MLNEALLTHVAVEPEGDHHRIGGAGVVVKPAMGSSHSAAGRELGAVSVRLRFAGADCRPGLREAIEMAGERPERRSAMATEPAIAGTN